MKSILILGCTVLLILSFLNVVHSDRILVVGFISTKSHKITYEPLLHELAKKGHEITILTPIASGKPIKNIRDIQTKDFETERRELAANLFEMKDSGQAMNPMTLMELFEMQCRVTYDQPHVRALMKENFDLVIVQPFFNDCSMGFVHHFNTSIMFMVPTVAPTEFTKFTGLPTLPSIIPNIFLPLTEKMTFFERFVNFGANLALSVGYEWYWKPRMERIYREKLGDPNLPGVNEIMSNVSLILSNSHFSLNQPRPFFPDTVDVGGMHCRPAKPLPKELDDFLNSSGDDGFIYFSMGSAIQAHTMPEKYRTLFVNAFAKLKQKVLWKWETETVPGLSPNVRLGKWLPQQDILGHPKIRMFITHGGFGGTTEAVYHGVPLLGIPMFGDQSLNMQQSEISGFALRLEFREMTEQILLGQINRILQDGSFHQRAKYLSSIFRDQAEKPLDRAVFWTEYVLRHKGAVHMRSAGRHLNFFQYYSLDVIVLYVAILVILLLVILKLISFVIRTVRLKYGTGIKSDTKSTTKKNN